MILRQIRVWVSMAYYKRGTKNFVPSMVDSDASVEVCLVEVTANGFCEFWEDDSVGSGG